MGYELFLIHGGKGEGDIYAPCHNEMIQIMNDHGTTIYIQLSPEALKDRLINSKTDRPLIKDKSEEELLDFIAELLAKRESYYNKARYILNGINLKAEELADLMRDTASN